jgi:hypothetical protein
LHSGFVSNKSDRCVIPQKETLRSLWSGELLASESLPFSQSPSHGEHHEKDVSLADQAASEDTRLALAMGREDLEAEREFALRFLPGIRAMLRARLRNSGRAADLVQDVMIDNRLSVSIRSPDANDPCISSGDVGSHLIPIDVTLAPSSAAHWVTLCRWPIRALTSLATFI